MHFNVLFVPTTSWHGLNYIGQLKGKNIPVYFEKENIDSMDSKGEIMLTIMASLAQQEI